MNTTWTKKWKQVLIWFSGYVSFLAFALVGGYTLVKEDEELKPTAKKTFVVLLIFAAISAFFSIFNAIGGLSDNYYSSAAYDIYSICTKLVSLAQIIVYATFIIMTLLQKEEN